MSSLQLELQLLAAVAFAKLRGVRIIPEFDMVSEVQIALLN